MKLIWTNKIMNITLLYKMKINKKKGKVKILIAIKI
jgi:hypothetical protein